MEVGEGSWQCRWARRQSQSSRAMPAGGCGSSSQRGGMSSPSHPACERVPGSASGWPASAASGQLSYSVRYVVQRICIDRSADGGMEWLSHVLCKAEQRWGSQRARRSLPASGLVAWVMPFVAKSARSAGSRSSQRVVSKSWAPHACGSTVTWVFKRPSTTNYNYTRRKTLAKYA